jgi:hypothetical protein
MASVVRPYVHPMAPRSLPPLASFLFGDDGEPDELPEPEPRPPRHRRPGPAVMGPGLPALWR